MTAQVKVPAFSLRGLEKRYPGFTLGPLDLVQEPGTVIGFVGPNGAGKTTTLACIAGLTVPEAGGVEILGRPNHPDDPSWKRQIGYVGEEHGFYRSWTVEENLCFLARLQPQVSLARAHEMAQRFGLALEARVRDLSKGNLTKLAVIAALSHGPRLLLLDEPTSGLDPVVRSEVLDVLWELLENGERAIFYSTHVLSDISRLADELVFLSDGRLLQRSSKDELTERWRRISFRHGGGDLTLTGVVDHKWVRKEHQVLTSDGETTLRQLGELGAEGIEQSRMTIDEIAIEILRGRAHVAAAP